MSETKKIYTIVGPTPPADLEWNGITEPTKMLSMKICINKLSTSKEQRDKFYKDLFHIARKDLTDK